MRQINKLLIANRGEIAVRIIKTAQSSGIPTVAVYSTVDSNSPHTKLADEAIFIGNAPASESYLDINKIIDAAKKTGANAIHPGYGFLSENSSFCKRCIDENILFIGPSVHSIESMGLKKRAKDLLSANPEIPLIPGYDGSSQDINDLINEGKKIGYPLLLKASAGGGGKGMKIVYAENELEGQILSAKSESKQAFGDDTLIIEKYFDQVRHIEVQIIGDITGEVFHFFERECSIQRRYQKVIEETPSIIMDQKLRDKMGNIAAQIGKEINYLGTGTVEFIFDSKSKNFYFLEVNTRIQVEHPITEKISGLDLIDLQIKTCSGIPLKELGFSCQNDVDVLRKPGHALECRLYAEDPSNGFLPNPGKIEYWKQSEKSYARYDTGIESGSEISIYYDPMIAKVIVYSDSRSESIKKMKNILNETIIHGLVTNQQFLIDILDHPEFQNGNTLTNFIDSFFSNIDSKNSLNDDQKMELTLAAFLWSYNSRSDIHSLSKLGSLKPGFRNNPYSLPSEDFEILSSKFTIKYEILEKKDIYIENSNNNNEAVIRAEVNGKNFDLILHSYKKGILECSINNHRKKYNIFWNDEVISVHNRDLGTHQIIRQERFPKAGKIDVESQNIFVAPMPSEVQSINVAVGDKVNPGDVLMSVYSMKTNHTLRAETKAVVKRIPVKISDIVKAKSVLIELEEITD